MSEGTTALAVREFIRARAALQKRTRPYRDKAKPERHDWRAWLALIFGAFVRGPYAEFHVEFWQYVFGIELGAYVRPLVTIWPRRAGKSTSSEVAAAVVGALRTRRYVLYVCATQAQANDHVQNIAALLESQVFAAYFPATARRKIGKYGHSKGWTQSRLRTEDGFTVHAIGLDGAARGIKIEGDRPDMIICDDLDELHDTPLTTTKKIDTLTKSILPTGSDNTAVIFAQNLILQNGIAARLVDGRADFLFDRIVSGPHPAIADLAYDDVDGRMTITGGRSTWSAKTLDDWQKEIDQYGISAFLAEFQHLVQNLSKGIWAKVVFQHCAPDKVPPLFDVQVWCDPAVTDTKQADAHGIQCDGITDAGQLYRLYSWEERTTPLDVIKRAITVARQFGASCVGVETDQGGDTWESVFELAWDHLVNAGEIYEHEQRLTFKQAKAGGHGSKAARSSLMLAAYERGEVTHVIQDDGSHAILEAALRRFGVEKPFDLADAAYWSWDGLANQSAAAGGSEDYTSGPRDDDRSHPVWGRRLHA